ncbi:MAG TPA: cation:proton antiporter, partial [Methylomirabilota bacterium]|nr:cation:proton antiporter [Methylomirabilota bacterium]
MENTWFLAALWVGLALVATLLAIWLRVSTALSEIVVGTVAQLIVVVLVGGAGLRAQTPWIGFLAGTGAIVLTFLAGAEIDPAVFRVKWKEATVVGIVSFLAPFLGSAAAAYYVLDWAPMAAWLAGVALSTTSVAVVYAVMLELGFNTTDYGKVILAACFITDLGTVIALGLIFAPFTMRTLAFVAASLVVFVVLPFVTPGVFRRFGGRVSEFETKFILLALFAMGGLALWADSEPVLPSYIIGMVLAGTVGKDHALIRRLRTLTFGLLTPFYFLRAGSLVSVPVLVAAPGTLIVLFFAKMVSKLAGVFPSVRIFGHREGADVYYTLMMSTGLTFGTIS